MLILLPNIWTYFCHLAELVFSLYLWLYPIVLNSSVEFSVPFLSEVDYAPFELEKEAGLPPPFAY
jgi:hypothetical protein